MVVSVGSAAGSAWSGGAGAAGRVVVGNGLVQGWVVFGGAQ